MKQTGHISVTQLYSTPGLLIESAKVNCFCANPDHAVEQFLKAIQWTQAIIQRKE